MVTLRRFTATEWRDLARGQRALAVQTEEQIEKNRTTTMEGFFIKAREVHLELAELCELYAKRAQEQGRI